MAILALAASGFGWLYGSSRGELCLQRSLPAAFAWFPGKSCRALRAEQDSRTAPGSLSPRTPPNDYPEAARKADKEGMALVQCHVVDEIRLANWRILSEDPPGLGFGAAAIAQVTSANSGLKVDQLKGHKLVNIPVHFTLAK